MLCVRSAGFVHWIIKFKQMFDIYNKDFFLHGSMPQYHISTLIIIIIFFLLPMPLTLQQPTHTSNSALIMNAALDFISLSLRVIVSTFIQYLRSKKIL